MSAADVCATRARPLHIVRCAPQTRYYADGLRAALAICDSVERWHDDLAALDDARLELRRALRECAEPCDPSEALAADGDGE